MAPLIFPLGHYFGRFYPERGAALQHHVVRVGRETPKLPDDAHMALWSLLHGLGSMTEDMPSWTRSAVEATANQLEIGDAAAIIDHLISIGVAVEVETEGDALMEFARTHRINTLLHGLGNTVDDVDSFGVGIPGVGPVVSMPIQEYELWQWGPIAPSLWDAYRLLTEVWRRTGATHVLNTDPAERLRYDVETMVWHKFLGHTIAYLDEVAPS